MSIPWVFVVVVNCDLVCAPRMVIRYVNEINVKRSNKYGYGVPLGPFAISSLAFLIKNKNARFSHKNSKRVWNVLV